MILILAIQPEGVSLDEKILTAETLQRYPFIKNFFRTFRITAGNKNHKYCQEIATNGIYKIFNGKIYYDETSFTQVRGANNIAYLKSVAEKWVEMGKNLHSQLSSGYQKIEANKQMNEYEKQIIAFEIELNKSRLQIRYAEHFLMNFNFNFSILVLTMCQTIFILQHPQRKDSENFS